VLKKIQEAKAELEDESWRPCPEATIKYVDFQTAREILEELEGLVQQHQKQLQEIIEQYSITDDHGVELVSKRKLIEFLGKSVEEK
jgi:hypothetical protein